MKEAYLDGILEETEYLAKKPQNNEVKDLISKLDVQPSNTYLSIGPESSRIPVILSMLGLNVTIIDKDEKILNYQNELGKSFKDKIKKAKGSFNVEEVDVVHYERYLEKIKEFDNKFDYIECVGFVRPDEDDIAEVAANMLFWCKNNGIIFASTCFAQRGVNDPLIKSIEYEAMINKYKLKELHANVFTSENYAYSSNGVMFKISKLKG